ncbi:hypothetical protein DFH08DRAFT_1079115 [Mycena albidolilacea]|uniref:DUF6534 domain-containing protein n=1 Tax=Mycena albidolilacea TaxID=1033008 RepID=A0AAD7ESL4_9AGAR|nr:hypothetical protein DFH08DRAFT_1079115 [Mycena albidolilacea]
MADKLDSLNLTIGAFIVGGMTSVGLSAVVGFQTFLYFRIFSNDNLRYRSLVAWIWLTDTGHTIAVCITIWQYAVRNFNNSEKLLEIVPAFPVNIVVTIIATLNANLFYTWRIHKMSKQNWWITGPIVALCLTRTAMGLFGAAEMLITKTWHNIAEKFEVCISQTPEIPYLSLQVPVVSSWAVSAATDVVISAARYYYLRELKQGYMSQPEMMDAVVIFTINDGLLTCAAVITTIICFLSMHNNFVWVGIYFNLAKLFSNSVLATLNLRNWYRPRNRPMGFPLTRQQAPRNTFQFSSTVNKSLQSNDTHDMPPPTMQVFVDQEVEYNAPSGKI